MLRHGIPESGTVRIIQEVETHMFQVKKDTVIAEIMQNAPETMPLFQSIGMHCMGCAMASGENVEQACAAHGVDADAFVEKLNAFIATL